MHEVIGEAVVVIDQEDVLAHASVLASSPEESMRNIGEKAGS